MTVPPASDEPRSDSTPSRGQSVGQSPPAEGQRWAADRALRTLEAGRAGAPLILMLHGLPGSAEDWNRLLPVLAQAGFHAVAVDRPGYGGSGAESLPVARQVELYAALLRDHAPGPALVVGHSYGAVPAAELAARHPSLVAGLGLLAPALREDRADREPPPGTEFIERLLSRPAIGSFVRATVLSDAGRSLIARVADPVSFAPDDVDQEHLAGVRDRTLQWAALRSFLFEAKRLQRDADRVEALLGTLTVPSAVIHAAGDRVVQPIAGLRTAQAIPRCEHHPIEGGHMLTISRADEVAPILLGLAARAGLVAPAKLQS